MAEPSGRSGKFTIFNRWTAALTRWRGRAAGRIAIYVAQFPGDGAVRNCLRRELPPGIAVLSAGRPVRRKEGDSLDDVSSRADEEAGEWLRSKGGSLLVWGQPRTIDGRSLL
jgi:hypothetical protein